MPQCPQVAEERRALQADEVEEISSYGSGHSNEGFLQTRTMALPADVVSDLPTLLAGIAGLARGQGIVVERLSYLEKVMGTVQFDMTWVRDDIKSVHQAMDRFGDYVCDVQDEVADVQREREQVSLDGSLRHDMKGKEHVVEFPRPPSASTSRGELQYVGSGLPGRDACRKDSDIFIQAPQPFQDNIGAQSDMLALIETGRRSWVYDDDAAPEIGGMPCQQMREGIDKEALEEESQQIEMSCHSTQAPTPVASRSMWEDFTAAIKDWRAPSVGAKEREEGWMSAKKGRWDLTDYGRENADALDAHMVDESVAPNLNFLPDKQMSMRPTRAVGDAATSIAITGASKSGGIGTWRGTASGRRPPSVQPRYHTSVRDMLKQTQ